jgi:DNA-binding beta-propeller fold protein YncE
MARVDRRTFLASGLALALAPERLAAAGRPPLALVTADTEGHVAVVDLARHRVAGRVGTIDGPRSIEARGRGPVIVGHASQGAVTLLEGRPSRVRRVLRGFGEPRYAAIAPDGRHAYVTDSRNGELAVLDLQRGRVVRRAEIGAGARHVTLDRTGRTVWAALGSSATEVVVVDVGDPARPRVRRRIRPPFLAHDVAFSPSGARVWVTAGRERRAAVYAADGTRPALELSAGVAPQHVAFGPLLAYLASGEGRSVAVHALDDGRLLRETRVPYGSYNVVRRAGRVLTPSLGDGTLSVLDARGLRRWHVRIASAAHDTCVVL